MAYTPPTPDQVRAFLKLHGLSGRRAAELSGLSGGQQIRKYTGGARPQTMGYALQFTLAAKVVLDQETVARIEAAMPVAMQTGENPPESP